MLVNASKLALHNLAVFRGPCAIPANNQIDENENNLIVVSKIVAEHWSYKIKIMDFEANSLLMFKKYVDSIPLNRSSRKNEKLKTRKAATPEYISVIRDERLNGMVNLL